MSTLPEVATARRYRMRVVAIATIANMALADQQQRTGGQQVLAAAAAACPQLARLFGFAIAINRQQPNPQNWSHKQAGNHSQSTSPSARNHANQRPHHVRVLFVGNSLAASHPMPKPFAQPVEQDGAGTRVAADYRAPRPAQKIYRIPSDVILVLGHSILPAVKLADAHSTAQSPSQAKNGNPDNGLE